MTSGRRKRRPLHSIYSVPALYPLISEQRVLGPLAVYLDEAGELFVVAADGVHYLQALAVYLEPRGLHEGLVVLADKVGEAYRVGLAVILREVALRYSGQAYLVSSTAMSSSPDSNMNIFSFIELKSEVILFLIPLRLR